MFYAHSLDGSDTDCWQRLAEHLVAVSKLAAQRGEKFGAGRAAALAGLLHDLGKYSAEFQRYISGQGPSPDHSTAGAIEVGRLVQGNGSREDWIVADLLAYVIAGHHAGLADRTSELSDRLKRSGLPQIDPAWRAEIAPEDRPRTASACRRSRYGRPDARACGLKSRWRGCQAQHRCPVSRS